MMVRDVLDLIAEQPEAHGIFAAHTETRRQVFVTVKSVGRNEYYRAMEQELRPAMVFVLANRDEYQGEKVCEYAGTRYRIVRTYVTQQLQIELTVEEGTVDG